jgi:hypothetical protein
MLPWPRCSMLPSRFFCTSPGPSASRRWSVRSAGSEGSGLIAGSVVVRQAPFALLPFILTGDRDTVDCELARSGQFRPLGRIIEQPLGRRKRRASVSATEPLQTGRNITNKTSKNKGVLINRPTVR